MPKKNVGPAIILGVALLLSPAIVVVTIAFAALGGW